MYNTDLPTRAELPSTWQLIRSTVIAIVSAAAILVTIVLPAEFGIDPTGVGRVLGLAEMGEIKVQLAKEAEEDRQRDQTQPLPNLRSSLERVIGVFISPAAAQTAPVTRSDEMTVTLQPGQGVEIKLEMKQGTKVSFAWSATAEVNYDLHGDGPGKQASYKKGRGVTKNEGVFTADFNGNHGWFWRNRTSKPVTITLKVNGAHTNIKRVA